MHVVAVTNPGVDREATARIVARAAGLAPAEARMRLAVEPPSIIARLPADAATTLVGALRAEKVPVVSCDEAGVGRDRLIARTFEFTPDGLRAEDRAGTSLELPWSSIRLVARGMSVHKTVRTEVKNEKRFDLGRAVVTQGLLTTRTEKREVKTVLEDVVHFLLVFAPEGSIGIFDDHAQFTSLGAQLQPTRIANINLTAALLKERAKLALHDDRLLRLGRREFPVEVLAELLWKAVQSHSL
jgi:hypothetical protein